jgi:hypothetical protein
MADEFDTWIEEQAEVIKGDLRAQTLMRRAVETFLETGKQYREADRHWAQTAEETNRPATQAEVFSNLLGSRFYRLLILGMFGRMMDDEINSGNSSQAILEACDLARARLEEHGAALEAELDYRVLPIRSLVGVQTCAGLATAAFLRDSR